MSHVAAYLRNLIRTAADGWNRFWFTPADPATLGLIRIFTGCLLLYTHAIWSFDLVGFFGPDGVLPAQLTRQLHDAMRAAEVLPAVPDSTWAWSHLYALRSPASLWTCHVAALVILAAFTVGWWTRATSVLAFLITVSYAHRALGTLFGLDQINGMLALYLMIGPSGDAFSVDAWSRSRRLRGPSPVVRRVGANIAIRLIQLHMCVIYLFAGLGKLLGETWWTGTALWGALANYEYQTLDMTWLAAHPLWVNGMTQLTLAWEISYTALVWPRTIRPVVLALAIPVHLGIAVCMGMITFGLAMLVGNMAFVDSQWVRAVLRCPAEQRTARAGQGRGGVRSRDLARR